MERQEEEEQCSEEPKPFCEDIQVLNIYVYILVLPIYVLVAKMVSGSLISIVQRSPHQVYPFLSNLCGKEQ